MTEGSLKIGGLDNLLKVLKGRSEHVRVGILGSHAHRTSEDGVSNATVGAAHEFGTSKLPERSFLRGPISEHLAKRLEAYGPLDKDLITEILKTKSYKPWLKIVGVIAEGIVAEAFGTNGFGKWAPHAPGYTNNTGMILVDTQQLRNSISSEVKAK